MKTLKAKQNFSGSDVYNILRLFDVLPIYPYTRSETKHDY